MTITGICKCAVAALAVACALEPICGRAHPSTTDAPAAARVTLQAHESWQDGGSCFQCQGGPCIAPALVCNGIADCPNADDEDRARCTENSGNKQRLIDQAKGENDDHQSK
jgi:Low-density lipoprotein receptor domain class A